MIGKDGGIEPGIGDEGSQNQGLLKSAEGIGIVSKRAGVDQAETEE